MLLLCSSFSLYFIYFFLTVIGDYCYFAIIFTGSLIFLCSISISFNIYQYSFLFDTLLVFVDHTTRQRGQLYFWGFSRHFVRPTFIILSVWSKSNFGILNFLGFLVTTHLCLVFRGFKCDVCYLEKHNCVAFVLV